MTGPTAICECGHIRAAHKLHLTGGIYRSGQCWADGCFCAEFEHETPSHLRAARGHCAAASSAETPAPTVSVGNKPPGVVASESRAVSAPACADGSSLEPDRDAACVALLSLAPVTRADVRRALATYDKRAGARPTPPPAVAHRR